MMKIERSLEERVARRLSLLDLTFPPQIKEVKPDKEFVPLSDQMEVI